MRLLHVAHSLRPETGGTAAAVLESAAAQQALGHEVEVAYLHRMENPPPSPLRIHAVGNIPGGYGWNRELPQWLNEQLPRFDAVIAHGLWQFHTLAVRQACQRLGKASPRLFIFPHGMLDPWFNHTGKLRYLKKRAYWALFERRNLQEATAVCYTCEEERRLARTSLPGYRSTDLIAGLGIQDPVTLDGDVAVSGTALCRRFPALVDRRGLLFLGRIHPKKGLTETISGYAAASRDYADQTDCPALVIAGPIGDNSHASELVAQAKHAGLAQIDYRHESPPTSASNQGPLVIWLPMLHGADKNAALAHCDALVLCSHQENFGIVVAEALAHGKPVLLSRAVNIWREVVADAAGFAEEDSVEGATRLFKTWRRTPAQERAQLSPRARRCFTSRFEVSAVNRELLHRIQSLATNEGPLR